ncbi:glycosyltransferase [Streptomyces albireticuli]|uniref:Glycosyl transferase n=1 Tax=Streptomyces albireticuli TaxID=1940 RepID=A0A2A2DCT8_9ACTN|nr:glycosyltransferase [Streptomyces albireticuli]MCD9141739.1 glycosyltransferase [Streptomyces albireticuli]MCD9165897.1 glycosyltransferase [Streptomyces albireticuli]MCD9189913.1 glycosyltransferase [Streptomyces albireticuli]PAU50298.1 glycosyl transferase [Streptomyces albireticuli]
MFSSPFLLAFPFLLLICFLLYWAGARNAYLRRPAVEEGDPASHEWHFFVPCRDEEAVVGTTVERLRADHPGAHVWVIDDDSEDRTGAIVAERAETDRRVHLVSRRRPEARQGKGAALNAAYDELNQFLAEDTDREKVVVCVIDADGQLDPRALARVSGPAGFGDPETGGVQVSVHMRNAEDPRPLADRGRIRNAFARLLVRMQDMEFSVSNAGMQLLRGRTGSVGLGGNGQFTRLAALDRIAAAERRPWQRGALLEDYELGLHMILNGDRISHIADTWVSQEGLPHGRRFLTQRTRWAQGNLQCVRYAPRIVSSRHYGGKGVLETLYTFLQPVAHLVTLALCAVMFAVLGMTVAEDGFGEAFGGMLALWPLVVVLAVVSVLPFVLWGPVYRRDRAPGSSLLVSLLWGLALWVYAYHLFPASARGFVRMLRGRNGWAKTRRNAEVVTSGPVAVES